MKRKISIALVYSLFLCTILTGGAYAASATPTSSTILIDGQIVSFDAYNIGGNNYLKLRDLGYSLTGTNAQFDVGWDGQSILLTSGKVYTPVGGEMSGKGTAAQNALPSHLNVIKDGVRIPMFAYNINGNNYFKLRDIAQILDFSVDWRDGKIVIETNKAYVMPNSTTLAVNSYPLLLVGMTKAQIDGKLGKPTVDEFSGVHYPNGLTLGYWIYAQGDVPADWNRCVYVEGRVEHIVSGCPSTLTLNQIRQLFGSGDVHYSDYSDSYVLSINYGNVPIVIDCDSKGNVTSRSSFYYNTDNPYVETKDYSWAEKDWSFSNAVKDSPYDEYPIGETVHVTIKEASADRLRLDAELTSWYGTSWVVASVDNVTLYSSDGQTYMAFGVTDSWGNSADITVQLNNGSLVLKSVVTRWDYMARAAFGGDYTLS